MQRVITCPICAAAFWNYDDKKKHLEWHNEISQLFGVVNASLDKVEQRLSKKAEIGVKVSDNEAALPRRRPDEADPEA